MVIVFEAQEADTPAGKPVEVPIPVALVVAIVMAVKAEFAHNVGFADGAAAVLSGVTVIVPAAFTVPQPPVRGML